MSLNYETPTTENGIITGVDDDSNKFLPASLALWLTEQAVLNLDQININLAKEWLITVGEAAIRKACEDAQDYTIFHVYKNETNSDGIINSELILNQETYTINDTTYSYILNFLSESGYTVTSYIPNEAENNEESLEEQEQKKVLNISWGTASEWKPPISETDEEALITVQLVGKLTIINSETGEEELYNENYDIETKNIPHDSIFTEQFIKENYPQTIELEEQIFTRQTDFDPSLDKTLTPLDTFIGDLEGNDIILKIPYLGEVNENYQ